MVSLSNHDGNRPFDSSINSLLRANGFLIHIDNNYKVSIVSNPTKNTYYLGIRHHGVGSTARLLSVLNALKPTKILIEGASDCTDLLPLLAHRQMKPPVALLAYATDYPESHFYYPFTEFSPEYQATLWAVQNGADVALIDLPIAVKLAQQVAHIEQIKADLEQQNEQAEQEGAPSIVRQAHYSGQADLPEQALTEENLADGLEKERNTELGDDEKLTLRLTHDPIGVLAELAGYSDGEDWWNDILEQNHTSGETGRGVSHTPDLNDNLAIFDSVANAMLVLRQKLLTQGVLAKEYDTAFSDVEREAYMRQQIAQHQKASNDDDIIVVVCGAWHVPALDPHFYQHLTHKDGQKLDFSQKSDNAIIKSLPKKLAPSKVKTTWIPWTSPRLASHSGYGAGVTAPMWYLHLWQNRHRSDQAEHWLSLVAQALRAQGHTISTASVIEAVRLSQSLAVVRERPSVGFEELTESAIACLCFGESLLWRQIANRLLLGNQVGQIPDDMPLAPLLEDLQRLQKQTKLAPESLAKEISLDLRSDIGLKKSHLLHRLRILGVQWGKVLDTGSSRGTFREKWLLEWQPEFAVELVENLVYGNTIAQASSNKLAERIAQTHQLSDLVKDVQTALQADLPTATDTGLDHLAVLANQTDSTDELLGSLSPLIHLERYGTARAMALEQVAELVRQLTIKTAIALPYATRQIDDDIASRYHTLIKDAHHALVLGELGDDVMDVWWQAIDDIAHSINSQNHAHSQLIGLCNRLLYQDDNINSEQLELTLKKALSPAIATAQSAQFFAGFFEGATQNLLFDDVLLTVFKNWLMGLGEDEFVEYLPLFRRVFASLDPLERKHLLERVTQGKQRQSDFTPNIDAYPLWQSQLESIAKLLNGDKDWAVG